MSRKIIAIDPGQKGAIVLLDKKRFETWAMPIGEDKRVDFKKVFMILNKNKIDAHVFLERAYGGQMGATAAFNYGADFCKIEIAIKILKLPVTYVEAAKWSKVIHQGISSDLKPKAKSIIAVNRLCPELISKIPKGPKSGKLDEGVVDALLIAKYGASVLK